MTSGKVFSFAALCSGGLVLAGCVMSEKYEAEKARALNFQRLLAQEEKRTGELDSELKRLKREMPDVEARTRELTAQLQAVREQLARVQEENAGLRESAALKAREELERTLQPKSKSVSPSKRATPKPDSSKSDLKADIGVPIYHEVKSGETLLRLARQYGVDVNRIKEWNNLRDEVIEVGQRLVVGYQ
jgi:septal ring factor EnvC (AmiA/AmiB activator)